MGEGEGRGVERALELVTIGANTGLRGAGIASLKRDESRDERMGWRDVDGRKWGALDGGTARCGEGRGTVREKGKALDDGTAPCAKVAGR